MTNSLHSETRAFDSQGLRLLRSGLEREVAAGFAPGVVGLVARGDDIETVVLGTMAVGGYVPMSRNTIFRIASMTKPITAAAVMMLVEEGKLKPDEPVERLLPELGNRRVLKRIDSELDDTVPAKRSITVEDLLTFRCGYGLILAPPRSYPIQRAIADLGIVGFGPPDPAMPFDNDEWMRRLGTLPLLAQPGESWLYTTGSNIQGVLIARASGQPLSRFLQERIFGPLDMPDTAFFVPPAKMDRFVPAYRAVDGSLVLSDDPANGKWSRPPAFEQGDAGLVSTADDFLAFARMLIAGGRVGNKSLLSPSAIEAMTTNHLSASQQTGGEMILGRGRGWGYGMAAVTQTLPGQPKRGAFGWNGGLGTSWFSDRSADLTAILLTQHEFTGPALSPIHRNFQANAYRSLA